MIFKLFLGGIPDDPRIIVVGKLTEMQAKLLTGHGMGRKTVNSNLMRALTRLCHQALPE
jgi:hypothetical protein